MIKKDAVWLIAGGLMQKIIAKRIHQRGLALILSDGSGTAFCCEMADLFLQLDTFDVEGHIEASKMVQSRFNLLGVVTTAADCHYTVNRLAEHLQLPHLLPSISEVCRNKVLTRKILTDAGLLQPKFLETPSFREASDFLLKANCDYVIKATDNSGSRGFSILPKGLPLSFEQYENARMMGSTGKIILEERLYPHQQKVSEASVETIWQDGEMYWVNWTDRIFPRDLKFFPQLKMANIPKEWVEIGHINPAKRSSEDKYYIWQDLKRSGIALGMHKVKGAHILKADIFFSEVGPIILELTPRTSGGWDSSGSSIERGADIPGGVLHFCMGHHLDLESWHRYFEFKYPEITSVVVSKIPENAEDCIGRKFALASGWESQEVVLSRALDKLSKGEFYVPVL